MQILQEQKSVLPTLLTCMAQARPGLTFSLQARPLATATACTLWDSSDALHLIIDSEDFLNFA
jgi:hypothetical protein